MVPVSRTPSSGHGVYSAYSVIRNSDIRKFCYKEHSGTAKSIDFSSSLLYYKEILL